MNIKKFIMRMNPVAKLRRNRMQKELANRDVSFLCPNSIGGILFHDLGLRFLSPTVNLMMLQSDFIKFVLNLDKYLNGSFEFFECEEYTCPCAHLKADGVDDITVHFTHYATKESAEKKWRERAERIKYDNLFVFLTERDSITKEQIAALKSLKVKGLVVFTANEYDDIPYALCIDKYKSDGEVGNILKQSYITGAREYEKYFDFVKWFNEADGKNYDIKKFVKQH